MDKPGPAYKGDGTYTFVCYAHADSEAVYSDIRWLQDQGTNIWYDEGISAGRIWRAEIARAIEGARSVAFFVSDASLESDHCNREINYALDRSVHVLPIYLADVELSPDLRVGLARVQALHRHAMKQEAFRASMLTGLSQRDSRSRTEGTPPPVKRGTGRRLQILPPKIFGQDPMLESFAEAIVEDVANALTSARWLEVVVSPSPADRGGAGFFVDGSLRLNRSGVRLTLQLTQSDGRRVWSADYEIPSAAVEEMQFDRAPHVASMIETTIGSIRNARHLSTTNDTARGYFLEHNLEWNKILLGTQGDWGVAVQHLERAIDVDSSFWEAHQALAVLYANRLGDTISAADATAVSHQHLAEIQKLAPDHWLTHLATGQCNLVLDLDYATAERNFARMLSTGGIMGVGFQFLGLTYLLQGRRSEAIAKLRSAVVSHAFGDTVAALTHLGTALINGGDYQQAVDVFEEANLAAGARGWRAAHSRMHQAVAHRFLGNTKAANSAADEAWDLLGSRRPELFSGMFALLGRTSKACQILDNAESRHHKGEFLPAAWMFRGYYFLGDLDRAFSWLTDAIENREWELFDELRSAEFFAGLRTDPRFDPVMERLEQIEAGDHR